MPLPSQGSLPVPKNDDEYDSMVRDFLRTENRPNIVRFGRRGQNQAGIDGFDQTAPDSIVYQATTQSDNLDTKLQKDIERMDSEWPACPSEFVFACSSLRDANLQRFASELTTARLEISKCPIRLVFWDDIQEAILEGRSLPGGTTLLEKYYPSFATGTARMRALTASAIAEYQDRIRTRSQCISTLAGGSSPLALTKVYEPLTLFVPETQEKICVSKFPADLLQRTPRILIIDSAGMGKSTLLAFIANAALREGYMPFIVTLRALQPSQSIPAWLAAEVECLAQPIDPYELQKQIQTDRCVVLLDGLDEIEEERLDSAIREIKSFSEKFKGGSIIMTSRNGFWVEPFTAFTRAHIRPLEFFESISLIRKYGTATAQDRSASHLIVKLEIGDVSSDVPAFLRTPLLASLLFLTFVHTPDLRLKRSEFYDRVYQALYDRHDQISKDGWSHKKQSGMSLSQLSGALGGYAFYTLARQKYECSEDEFREIVCQANICTDADMANNLLSDLTRAVPILVKDGQKYRWSHRVLQDYFAAQYILRARHFIPRIRASKRFHKYTGMIKFVSELDGGMFRREFAQHVVSEYLSQIKGVSPNGGSTWARLTAGFRFAVGFYSLDTLRQYGYGERGTLSASINSYVEAVRPRVPAGQLPPMGGQDFFVSDRASAVSVRFRQIDTLTAVVAVFESHENTDLFETFPRNSGTLASSDIRYLSLNTLYLDNGTAVNEKGVAGNYIEVPELFASIQKLLLGTVNRLLTVSGMERIRNEIETELSASRHADDRIIDDI